MVGIISFATLIGITRYLGYNPLSILSAYGIDFILAVIAVFSLGWTSWQTFLMKGILETEKDEYNLEVQKSKEEKEHFLLNSNRKSRAIYELTSR